MPTYDYVCDACAHQFEHFQGIAEPHLLACPACRRRKLRRLIGAGSGVVFKGSGFYETDYKRAVKGGKAAPVGDTPAGAPSTADARDTAASPDSASKGSGPEAKRDKSSGADAKRPESQGPETKRTDPKQAESKSADAKRTDGGPADARGTSGRPASGDTSSRSPDSAGSKPGGKST